MKGFKNSEGSLIVRRMITVIQKNKDYLSEIDGAIGDGDHGINMNKGFTFCEQRMEGKDLSTNEALNLLGTILMSEIGGSMGPLYGSFFRAMAREADGHELIDGEVFYAMLNSAAGKLSDLGNAKVGDKTLMDALIPAVSALRNALDSNSDLDVALQEMSHAAKKGRDSTKDMVAKIGRSARLGERSRGVLDAGATSCALLLDAMKDAIIELL